MKEAKHRRPHVVRFHFYELSRIGQNLRDKKEMNCWRRLGDGEVGNDCSWDKVSSQRDETVRELQTGNSYYTENHLIVALCVSITVHESFLNQNSLSASIKAKRHMPSGSNFIPSYVYNINVSMGSPTNVLEHL